MQIKCKQTADKRFKAATGQENTQGRKKNRQKNTPRIFFVKFFESEHSWISALEAPWNSALICWTVKWMRRCWTTIWSCRWTTVAWVFNNWTKGRQQKLRRIYPSRSYPLGCRGQKQLSRTVQLCHVIAHLPSFQVQMRQTAVTPASTQWISLWQTLHLSMHLTDWYSTLHFAMYSRCW